MNTHIFTWREALDYILDERSTKKNRNDWCSVLTYSRKLGLGTQVSFQQTQYNNKELITLHKIVNWWLFLNSFSNIEFRDKNTTQGILNNIVPAFINGREIVIFAIFCPSYKKKKGDVGYTGKLGENTKRAIKLMVDFVKKSSQMGLKIRGVAYFSDLLLENYHLLKNTDYKQDLDKNFLEFQDEFKRYSALIETSKLSRVKELHNKIGEAGISNSIIDKNNNLFKKMARPPKLRHFFQ